MLSFFYNKEFIRSITQPHSMHDTKILIVDDSRYFLNLHDTFLNRSCCRLIKAKNGEEALWMIKKEQPSIIIMDLDMPVIRGDECCRLIKSDDKLGEIPIIMVKSAWEKIDPSICNCSGCDDIITKPINKSRLIAGIKRFIDITERKHPRIACKSDVDYSSHGSKFKGSLFNISEGGMFIKSEKPLPVGTMINTSFKLFQNMDTVEIYGEVKRAVDYEGDEKPTVPRGMGIEFISISEEAKKALKNFLLMKKTTL